MNFKKSYIIDLLILALILTGIWIGVNRYRYFEVMGPSVKGTESTVQALESHGFEVFSEVRGTSPQGAYGEFKGKIVGTSEGRIYLLVEKKDNEVIVVGEESNSKTVVDIIPKSVKLDPYNNVSLISLQLKPMDNFTTTKNYFKGLLRNTNYSNAFISCDFIYPDVSLPETSTTWKLKRKISGGIFTNNTEEGFFLRTEYVPYGSFKLLNSEISRMSGKDVQPNVGPCYMKIYLEKEITKSPQELNLYEKGNLEHVEVK